MNGEIPPSPTELVGRLGGELPIALLPVRLETLFAEHNGELRIRIYPDALHVHTHEPELTEEEIERGRRYWLARWRAKDPGPAWERLAAQVSPVRAAWIARVLTPTNLTARGSASRPRFPVVPRKDSPWTLPPRAWALPERWIAVGYRGGNQLFLKMGEAIQPELAVGPAPDPEGDLEIERQHRPEAEQSELAIDEGMAWITEYPAALAAGMAITVVDSDVSPNSLQAGLDRLLVVGVRGGEEPGAASQRLADLLEAHSYTEGLSLLRQGTPTNNTATVTSAFDPNEPALKAHLDPAAPAPALDDDASGRRLCRALGLAPATALDRVLNADLSEDSNASHMNRVLWEATWGYFLDHQMRPLVDDDNAALARDHFVRFLRGRGPLPALRIGDQPYGVLPVVAPGRFVGAAEEPMEGNLAGLLQRLRGVWERAVERAPGLGQQGDPAADLLDLLESTPHSVSVRVRNAFGPLTVANSTGLSPLARAQEAMGRWVASLASAEATPHAARIVTRPQHYVLELPFVQAGKLSESEPLSENYLRQIAELLLESGGFNTVQAQSAATKTLLDALIRHAAALEFGKTAGRLIIRHRLKTGQLRARPTKVAELEPELVEANTRTLLRMATLPFAPLTGRRSMAEFIVTQVPPSEPDLAQLQEFVASLQHLADLPTAELHRLTAEELDLCSYRLDAWATSLAARRLQQLRDRQPVGIHLGGYGWVENLRPDTRPDSLGYVHTPSVAHAATAAVLRSGHLGHRHRDAETLAIDLSSQRVQKTLQVLEGVRQGQPLGALLGYRFERGLRERSVSLAKWILPLRKLAPLPQTNGGDQTGPLEAMAARDVVDGVKLLELWKLLGQDIFGPDGIGPVPSASERAGIAAELEQIEDLLDAVSDLLLAESVHQSTLGNTDRAAAAMDALDRQGPPPDPDVIRTPRTGLGLQHRLLVTLQSTTLPPAWRSTPVDPRAAAEPRLNAWVGQLLGNPRRFRFAVELLGEERDADGNRVVLETLETRLPALRLSPLATLWAATGGAAGRGSELEERIVFQVSSKIDNPEAVAELRLLEGTRERWPDSTIGLRGLLAMAAGIERLLGGRRAMTRRDLSLGTDSVELGINEAELGNRAATAVEALVAARNRLDRVLAARRPSEKTISTALLGAADFGIPGAVPADLSNREQLQRVRADVQLRVDAAAAAEEPLATIHAVFGDCFLVLPLLEVPAPDPIADSLADKAALLAGDKLAPTTWLQRMALVRPEVAALDGVLTTAEATGGLVDPTDLLVAQLPHRPGDRWLALPLDDDALPSGELGLVIHAPGGLNPRRPQAGLVVDEWFELLPSPTETTGVSFHYDAPGARAPQSLLLAVPPELDAETWNLEWLLDTVHEAADLTRIRAVDPQRIWLSNRYLPAIYLPANARNETSAIDLHAVAFRHRAANTTPGDE
jgi:hypothetical protein